MVGGQGDDQLWGSGRGAIAGCHCRVPIFVCSSYFQGHQFHPDTVENNNEFCLELLANVTLFSTLITQKIGFGYLGSMLVLFHIIFLDLLWIIGLAFICRFSADCKCSATISALLS